MGTTPHSNIGKNSCLLFLLLFQAVILSAQSPFDFEEKPDWTQLPAEARWLKTTFVEAENYEKWDVTYNRIELNVDPNANTISGTVYFELKALYDQLSAVTIDLSDSLNVKSITKWNSTLNYSRSNDKLTITFPNPLKNAEKTSFTIAYDGKPRTTGFGAFTQKDEDGQQVIYTLSEPYGAMEWWPCKQSLIDKIDSIDVVVTSPEKYRTASNGLLIADVVQNSKRTCHWKHRHPIATYLIFFSTTNYVVYSDWAKLESGSTVEILNYVYPNTEELARQMTPKTIDYIKLYSKLFIDYPFKNEKYGHAQFGWGGGMEHQTMTSMGGFSGGLIAHELAHQWFGDYITCGSWKEIWLNEGFATFLAGLAVEVYDPEWWYAWRKSIVDKVTKVPDGSVYCADTSDINRIFSSRLSYNKGGYVLHILRGQLGDERFFAGMKKYVTDPRVANGFATTALFRENMELGADTTLGEFINDWIYGEGFPIYDINWFYQDKQLVVSVNQSNSVANGPFFEMKIPVRVFTDGDSITYWLSNTKTPQQFTLSMKNRPDSVKVDPDLWLLSTFRSITNVKPIIKENYSVINNFKEGYLLVDAPDVVSAACTLYTLDGKPIGQQAWSPSENKIQVRHFPTGIYLLKYSSNSTNFISKVMIAAD
jgi:aminopeptidase N